MRSFFFAVFAESYLFFPPFFIRLTCVYLACKVEEFNVSIMQFCNNLQQDQEKAAELILGHELLVMQQLNFQLTVHNPFRPLEGLFIDIKVPCHSIFGTHYIKTDQLLPDMKIEF